MDLSGYLLPGTLADVCAALSKFVFEEEGRLAAGSLPDGDPGCEDDVGFRVVATPLRANRHFNACDAPGQSANVAEVLGVGFGAGVYEVVYGA